MVPQDKWDFSSVFFSPCYKFISQFTHSIHIRFTCKVLDHQKQLKLHMQVIKKVSLMTHFISSVLLIQMFQFKCVLPEGKTEETEQRRQSFYFIGNKHVFSQGGVHWLLWRRRQKESCNFEPWTSLCWREVNRVPALGWMVLTGSIMYYYLDLKWQFKHAAFPTG